MERIGRTTTEFVQRCNANIIIHEKLMINDSDQLYASIRDSFPRFWYALYVGCMDAGFNPEQAVALVQTYILSQNPSGIRPENPGGTKEERGA